MFPPSEKANKQTIHIYLVLRRPFFPTSVIENRNSVNASLVKRRRCSRERNEDCPKFVDRYSSFYLKIGGWLMLGIVLAGITALGATHFLGMRTMHRPRRRELSRILWVEARTKSKLARFVWQKYLEKKIKKTCAWPSGKEAEIIEKNRYWLLPL